MKIHSTAIVSGQADIAAGVEIGPYSVVDGEVTIGSGTVIDSHVRIGSRFGKVVVGEDNFIQSGAALGGPPQDWSYEAARTTLEIGAHNRIGEGASVNLGSDKGGGVTRVGNNAFIMSYAHVGHDCQIGDGCILTNLAQLAGHVVLEQGVVVSGIVGVTQFVRLGEYSFIAAGALVNKDILPYTIAEGQWAAPRATNKVGLRRAGYSTKSVREIDKAIRILLRKTLTLEEAIEEIRADVGSNAQVEHLIEFASTSNRGIARS